MDLNHLFHRHQVALMRHGRATSAESRSRLASDASALCDVIGRHQRQRGARSPFGELA